MRDGAIVVVSEKPAVHARLARAAAEMGRDVLGLDSLAQLEPGPQPAAVVVDLDDAHGIEAAAVLRAQWPTVLLAGFMSIPDRDRWDGARAAGYDVVTNRGAVAAQLKEKLATWTGPRARRLFRLMDAADTAGRLGCVTRVEDTPVGDVAVYHIGKRLYAAEDSCPHAGASLCGAEMEDGVVTCPLHGSRFDVRTGARVRGPADRELATFPVIVEDGGVFIEIPHESEEKEPR